MTIRLTGPLLCSSGLILFAALASTPAPAAPTSVTCNPAPTKLRATISEDAFISFTSSTTYSNVPQAGVAFTQGGTVPSCVVVRFSAVAGVGGSAALEVRAVLDNVTVALPPEVRFGDQSVATAAARSYEFIFPNVVPGAHVLRMQFRSSNGVSVSIDDRTTVVLFK